MEAVIYIYDIIYNHRSLFGGNISTLSCPAQKVAVSVAVAVMREHTIANLK